MRDFGSTVRNYDLVGYWGGYKEKGHTIEASKADHHANMQGRNMWADFYALDLKEHADGKWIDTWNVCKYITGKGLEDQKKPHPDMPWTQPKPKPKPKPKIVPSGPSRHPPTGTFDQPLD